MRARSRETGAKGKNLKSYYRLILDDDLVGGPPAYGGSILPWLLCVRRVRIAAENESRASKIAGLREYV